jgi:hypothetical protein
VSAPRFFIGHDQSGHEYLVPLGRIHAWRDWCAIDEDDERSWDVPDFARRIDGGALTFTDPRID